MAAMNNDTTANRTSDFGFDKKLFTFFTSLDKML